MPDPTLHGNGEHCPACGLRRENDPWQRRRHACNLCGGTGRIAFGAERIIADHVAEACAVYWPAFDARAS